MSKKKIFIILNTPPSPHQKNKYLTVKVAHSRKPARTAELVIHDKFNNNP